MSRQNPRATCTTCAWWERIDAEVGRCRFRAPDHSGDWPETEQADWCGDHDFATGPHEDKPLRVA